MSGFLYELKYPWLDAADARGVTCCICNGKSPQYVKFRFKINGAVFSIAHCSADGIFYLSPQPGKKYCESLYGHPSYFEGKDDMYGVETDDEKSREIAEIRISELRRYAPNAKSILEIGCAKGHFLEAAAANGFEKVKGLEISREAVEECRRRGLDADYADINGLQTSQLTESYDIIAGYSILEHLYNPPEFLKKIKAPATEGGLAVMRVPDTDPDTGPRLSLVDHFWHFTRASVKKVFAGAGYEIVDIFASGVFKGLAHGGEMQNMTLVAEPKHREK